MTRAAKKSTRVAPRPRAKPRTAVPAYVDPRDFEEVYAILVTSDHLEPDYPKGSYLIVDKRLPCEKHDLVVIYPLPDAAKSGAIPSVVYLQTLLSPGITLPVRLHPESNCGFALCVSDTKFAKKFRVWDAHKMQAMYRVSRIAASGEVAVGVSCG
jgi:hypothetical protein